ncbi:unnamed protein product [Adineta ricciae]|uniref:CARD domain-containing protein n=1 Tax=Adineta ricciae TaxID=249248 RepID=A0A813RM76_ADIRI|nr:unnamed protein product [Adineta ricciae]CAF1348797.1 unnamed protein product [Adineta ricciae]
MVNSKKCDLIERYRSLLENNLVLTDDFLAWFRSKKILAEHTVNDIKNLPLSVERNKKFLSHIIDEGDAGFTKLVEGLIANGQPFLGELLESEDKKASADAAQQIVLGDEFLKKCPGVDKLRADTREKMKSYLQDQLVKAHVNDSWSSQNQGKSVEFINLKRQHYETRQKLIDSVEDEKRTVESLKETLREEQQTRQRKEEEMKELRLELKRVQADYEQKWTNQIKMADANNRTVFSMNDKMALLTDWLRTLDTSLKTNISQTGMEFDSNDQLQVKLKRYTTEIESLRTRSIGTEKLKEEMHEALYTSRYLPIEDRKNRPFYDFLVSLYGSNQVTELANICTKDVLQSKSERDQANELRTRDMKIDELDRRNRELQTEIDRLKTKPSASTPAAAATAGVAASEHSHTKPTKQTWRPTPATVTPREKPKGRQTLKPIAVQFDTKPGGN